MTLTTTWCDSACVCVCACSFRYVVYDFYSQTAQALSKAFTVNAGYEGHVYAIAAPVTGDLAFVGERSK